jgi:Na+-driven multidrug efflux pump
MASGPGQRDLTTGPIARTLLIFALPTLGSSILQSLNGSINAVWVGRLLGEDALAATSNANIVMFLLTSFVFGLGMAATILIGQAFGRGDVDAGRRVVGTATGAFVVVAFAVAATGWLLAPHILRLLATPAEAAPLALAYLRVIFIAMPPALVMVSWMMALRGSGDAFTPLWFMILAVVLDSGLNPVFILGLGPAPRMGIAGAATATVIANYISLIAFLVYIYARICRCACADASCATCAPTLPSCGSSSPRACRWASR